MAGRDPQVVVVLLEGGEELASWPLPIAGRPAGDVVDEVAGLQLAARRCGLEVQVHGDKHELGELLAVLGLFPWVNCGARRSGPAAHPSMWRGSPKGPK